jgi:hypothetical protein
MNTSRMPKLSRQSSSRMKFIAIPGMSLIPAVSLLAAEEDERSRQATNPSCEPPSSLLSLS